MIYSILAYGHQLLRKRAIEVKQGTDVTALISAMFATMDQADGVGLAAPQIGQSMRLFVVDLSSFVSKAIQQEHSRKVYINPSICLDNTAVPEYHQEGCLSFPSISIEIPRAKRLVINYFDMYWQQQSEELTDMVARVIQHEYDHLEGKLFIDYATPLKRRLLKSKLADISQGKVTVNYQMKFLS